ncbi:hypothetical protein AB833_09940 [Chromatiales bacterium (ex Bugula neritina AB1)]|nr:hypothetical protein AB833_09940 [Chromatiales bacterium (ex Bugula neritina AB1)]
MAHTGNATAAPAIHFPVIHFTAQIKSTSLHFLLPRITLSSLLLLAAALIIALSAARPALADMGPLTQHIEAAADDQWIVSLSDGKVRMENTQAWGFANYYYAKSAPAQWGSRKISVTIDALNGSNDSYAGLLYAFHENPASYLVYTVGGDSSLNLHSMLNNRYDQVLKLDLKDPKGPVTLTIEEKGDRISLFANDRLVTSYGNSQTGTGASGIIAANPGTYLFSNFSIQGDPDIPAEPAAESQTIANNTGVTDNEANDNPVSDIKVSDNRLAPPAAPAPAGDQATGLPQAENSQNPLFFKSIVDPDLDLIQLRAALPDGWRFGQPGIDQLQIIGPDNITVSKPVTFAKFLYASDALARQSIPSTLPKGVLIEPVMSLSDYLLSRFIPEIREKLNYRFLTSYPTPEFIRLSRDISVTAGNAKPRIDAIGTEWQTPEGEIVFASLTQTLIPPPSPGGIYSWTIQLTQLNAPRNEFRKAIDAYRKSIDSTEINPVWLQAAAAKGGNGTAVPQFNTDPLLAADPQIHWQRINAIYSRNRADTTADDIYGKIADINHSAYLTRSNLIGQGQTGDTLLSGEFHIVSNPDSGEQYRINTNSKYHWISSEGQKLSTDNPSFDPRSVDKLRQQEWSLFEPVQQVDSP